MNVGAGTGSYEPADRDVTAVEPSALMREQRPAGAAPCVAAAAESLPFEEQSFDAAMAFATIHHRQDPIAGLHELRRVPRRVVVFTHDTSGPVETIEEIPLWCTDGVGQAGPSHLRLRRARARRSFLVRGVGVRRAAATGGVCYVGRFRSRVAG
ncbi:hypothetical protein GCM10023322_13010 [Rugosimonospora acidiphila]|uniref:Methyltransferase type 11 domain-containing protein n=1 Tax=Rugosimonospora acidiphila TaxID=556531 RepID=A0ABP9RMI9_9ACTN